MFAFRLRFEQSVIHSSQTSRLATHPNGAVGEEGGEEDREEGREGAFRHPTSLMMMGEDEQQMMTLCPQSRAAVGGLLI